MKRFGCRKLSLIIVVTTLSIFACCEGAPADPADIRESESQDKIKLASRTESTAQLEISVAQASSQISQDPKNAEAYKKRGLAQYRLEQFGSAKSDLQKSAELAPQKMSAIDYRILGECYVENHQDSEALAIFTKAIELTKLPNGKLTETWRMPKNQSDLAGLYLRRAQALANLQRYPEALKQADQIIALVPKQYWAFEFRARLNETMKRYKNVIDDCSSAIKINPSLVSSYSQRANAYEKLGDKKRADLDRQQVSDLTKRDF